MPLTFYGLKSCDSCRAALKALAVAGIEVDHRDVRDDGVPAETLRQAIERHGADKVINRRSTTWRELANRTRPVQAIVGLVDSLAVRVGNDVQGGKRVFRHEVQSIGA